VKLFPGSVLAGRYTLISPLGEGGMGEVWSAIHVVTKRSVAVKRLLHALHAHPDGQARARFVLEAQSACAVEHPNVVEILDFIESSDEPPVIVMELLQGETLAARLWRERALTLEETARVLLPVVSAVGTAHSRGIVHRDLKPANVFLTESGEGAPVVKVLDFGIAKWLVPLAGESALRTQTGSTLGTPSYMAPEQAIGDRMVDHKVDVWSLGVILYECLSGARPVEGENAAHMVMRLLSTGIIPIGQLVPSLPVPLADLIGRMLSREPAQRPRDLREVCAALAPLTSVSVPAFGEPRVHPVSPPIVTAASSQASAPPVSLGRKTPRVPATVVEGDSGESARPDRVRARRRAWRWALLVTGTTAGGVLLAAVPWFRSAGPSSAGVRAAPLATLLEPIPGPPASAPESWKARAPSDLPSVDPVDATGDAHAALPASDARVSPRPPAPGPVTESAASHGARPEAAKSPPTARPRGTRDAPVSPRVALSSEPTRPAAAPINPLDIELQ
jgi:eukaryotic-like serine/threonine-protein kinase